MSLILRLRNHLPNGISVRPFSYALGTLNPGGLNEFYQRFSQPARKEEEEEVEYDQRRLPADYDPATFDPSEHCSPPTERVFRLVDEISSLTLAEVAALGSIIIKKKGMTVPSSVGVMKPGAAAIGLAMKGPVAAKEEKKVENTVFELKLESFEASSKIKLIKEVRSFTDLGLKEAKDLVEKAPSVLKAGVSKEEGEQLVEKLKALGAVTGVACY